MELKPYIRQLRPRHWLKNVFVFIPLVFALELSNPVKLTNTIIVFAAFCFISSSVYIFNDILDIESDKSHPVKQNRPLASGAIGIKTAFTMAIVLMMIALGLALFINALTALIIVLYIIENVFYSLFLKHKPIYDCFCIAAGFVLRIYAGGFAADSFVSDWLFLTVVTMSLFMAFGKRRGEMLKVEHGSQRMALHYYNMSFLSGMMFVCAGLSVVFYSLWAMNHRTNMIYTVPLIVFIICRYLLIIYSENSHGDPTSIIWGDKSLIAAVGIFGLLSVMLLYL